MPLFNVSVHRLLPPPDGFACLHTSSFGSGGDESLSKMAAEIATMAQAAEGHVERLGNIFLSANTLASVSF